MKVVLRRVAEIVAPNYSRRFFEARWLQQHARDFAVAIQLKDSIEARVDYAREHTHFRSNQKRLEIMALLKMLERDRPRLLCEIGADRGGTLALLASVAGSAARILSLDIHYPASRARTYRALARPGQELNCLEADSHSLKTLEHVRDWLRGEALDFLFIDGDHSYQGVRADYESYGPLVRPGGMIAFHDIVQDFRMRFGRATPNDVGDVPIYWSELKRVESGCTELIEDPDQDGYGIGVITVGGQQPVTHR